MILYIHISVALMSVILTVYNLFRPTTKQLQIAYGLLTGTLLSGSFLIMTTSTPLQSVCISGLTYAAVAISGVIYSGRKLAYRRVSAKNVRERD